MLVSAMLISAMLVPAVAGARDEYEIIDLGSLGGDFSRAEAINDRGQITGVSETDIEDDFGIAETHAFLWLPEPRDGLPAGMTDLGTLGGGASSRGLGIGDGPTVVGESDGGVQFVSPIRWRSGVMEALETDPGPFFLFGNARAINRRGDIVGSVSGGFDCRATIWLDEPRHGFPAGRSQLTPMLGFANGVGNDINDRGEIVGTLDQSCDTSGDVRHAFLWLPEPSYGMPAGAIDLTPDAPAGRSATATAINEMGQVVGSISNVETAITAEAFFWQDGALSALPSLIADSRTEATDINNDGIAVGESGDRAVRWYGGVVRDLNELVPAARGDGGEWTLTKAHGINDRGQIVGEGRLDGNIRGFLLNPVDLGPNIPALGPFGAALLALVLALLGLGMMRR